jgi:hypothetical protein
MSTVRAPSTVIAKVRPTGSPRASRTSAASADSFTLPNVSSYTTSVSIAPSATRATGSGDPTSGPSIAGPSDSNDAPRARCAAAGANTSRPWNVLVTTGKRGRPVHEPARLDDAAAALGRGDQQPVVGTDQDIAPAGQDRQRPPAVPTPGSTTATWNPTGRYGSAHHRASARRGSSTCGPRGEVDDLGVRADPEHDRPADRRDTSRTPKSVRARRRAGWPGW